MTFASRSPARRRRCRWHSTRRATGAGSDLEFAPFFSLLPADLRTQVVVGSWYGTSPVTLTLGTAIHRSHIELVFSQVSRVSGALADRWSKGRRLDAAWSLLRALEPSRSLVSHRVPLSQAQVCGHLVPFFLAPTICPRTRRCTRHSPPRPTTFSRSSLRRARSFAGLWPSLSLSERMRFVSYWVIVALYGLNSFLSRTSTAGMLVAKTV